MEPKVSTSFFESFASPGTHASVIQGRREHVRDMYKIKLVENMVLGQEIISWLDENELLHLENRRLHDKFKKISDLIKPFIMLSLGVAHNMQFFRYRQVELVEKFVELEKAMPNMGVVPQGKVDNVKDEVVVVKNENVLLERKLVGYDDVVDEVSTLKATMASLELEKLSCWRR